ncbi:MAG TPA: hypothetical protein VIH28_06985 [Ignavibacteriaceae bacterium]
MTLDKLKSEYKKSITLEGDDLEQITEEIDEADTLDEFIAIAGMWANKIKNGNVERMILDRILQVE